MTASPAPGVYSPLTAWHVMLRDRSVPLAVVMAARPASLRHLTATP